MIFNQMPNNISIPNVIGMEIDVAQVHMPSDFLISVKETITPFDDKKAERVNSKPIVVRQRLFDKQIELTVSYFK